MLNKHIKLLIVSALCVLVLVLAGCGDPAKSSESGPVPGNQGGAGNASSTPVPTTAATANATVITGTAAAGSTPPAGPKVINTPTQIPGGNSTSQQVPLKDRTLLITDVQKQKGADATVVSIILTLTVKNTSGQAIKNQPEFFQLVGSEGDTFGKQSNSSDAFYGSIDANGQRSGTIVFQVPSAAAGSLRLMYRPENPSETVFTPLNI